MRMRMFDYSAEIKAYRKRQDMTQEELAEILGVQAKYISLLENGKRSPSGKLQKKMEELILAEDLKKECAGEEMPATDNEVELQMRIFRKLSRLQPVVREQAVDLICQILDMMSAREQPKDKN